MSIFVFSYLVFVTITNTKILITNVHGLDKFINIDIDF